MWMCTLFIAGMTVLPVRSTRVVPVGAVTAPLLPTAVMRPFWTTKAPLSIGALASPMTRRAPWYRTALDEPRDCVETAIDAIEPTAMHATKSFNRPMRHLHYPASLQLREVRRAGPYDDPLLVESGLGGRAHPFEATSLSRGCGDRSRLTRADAPRGEFLSPGSPVRCVHLSHSAATSQRRYAAARNRVRPREATRGLYLPVEAMKTTNA